MQSIPVLYEDNHLYVVNKPAGLLTQKDATSRPALEDLCREALCQKTGKKAVFLHTIHRLDRPASGIVLFARSSKALSRLKQAMREGTIQKTYWALVEGEVTPKEGEWEDWLIRDSFRASLAPPGDPLGKRALLRYHTHKKQGKNTLLEIDLVTGRYHQIRAQAQFHGHPILGDEKYGSRNKMKPETIALHHRQMTIIHPTTKEQMTFQTPIPEWAIYTEAASEMGISAPPKPQI